MHVRCPHCHNPIEIVDDSTLHDVECPSCGSNFSLVEDESTAAYQPGTKTIGHFELIEQLGMGAFGAVWKAHDTKLDRTVAIKIPRKDQLSAEESEQFLREARSAAQLKHPSIVSVHEVGRENDQLYIVSDFVQGATLADWIEGQTLTSQEAAELTAKIAEALQHAHDAGVIHRDLKPANIMMDLDGEPHIMDFGLAKRESGEITMTVDGKVLGTPAYMPPEQARGEGHNADARSDVYSLGVILFQLLTGELPFRGNPRMLIVQILKDDPPSLRKLNSSVPRDFETICLKCLEKEPAKRYESAQALADDLGHAIRGEPIHARASSRLEKVVRWCRREPAKATAVMAILLLAIGGPWSSIRQSLLIRQNAIARVDTLLNAAPATIPLVLQDLDRQASVVLPRLRELDAQELSPSQKLRLSLALLPSDVTQLPYLKDRLNDCTYEELSVVLERLKQHNGVGAAAGLWPTFHSHSLSHEDRFRAGIALALLDPESDQWIDEDYQFLAASMLQENTVYQPEIRQSLQSLAGKLLDPVKQAFSDATANDTVRESAANAIVDFADNDSELLIELSMVATPKQYSILFPPVDQYAKSDDSIVETFVGVTKLQSKVNDNEAQRVALGMRRAGAAINLLRLDRPVASLEVLRVKEDPESLTQFVHGCRARGITVDQLLDLLNRATSVSERYGILLALGEFELADVSETIRSTWVDYLKGLYANDQSSAIHGASGWLLRHWGFNDAVREVDHTAIPFDDTFEREWFVIGVDVPQVGGGLEPNETKRIYFTMIVFRAGDFMMGTPDYEEDREVRNEQLHRVELTRPLALSDREVTWEQFNGFDESSRHDSCESVFGHRLGVSEPTFGVSWFDVVRYCRWLSAQMGVPESEQCYDSGPLANNSSSRADHVTPPDTTQWRVKLDGRGFRLPTEAEWEYACRSSTATTYSFGSDRTHLGSYCWSSENSGVWSHAVAVLRPNVRGLYDMHGNLSEWCHDWLESGVASGRKPVGPAGDLRRVNRGGSWDLSARSCRSGDRYGDRPTSRLSDTGFRLALVPQSSQAGSEPGNGVR